MADTTTTPERIAKLADREAFNNVMQRFGGNYIGQIQGGLSVVLARELSIADVRNVAHAIRKLTDPDLPNRPDLVAAALDKLAAETERRDPVDSDIVRLDATHRELIRLAEKRCRDRSPLLEPLAHDLNELWWSSDPRVGHVLDAVLLLADADLLLPGVDAELRPVLALYAPADVTGRQHAERSW